MKTWVLGSLVRAARAACLWDRRGVQTRALAWSWTTANPRPRWQRHEAIVGGATEGKRPGFSQKVIPSLRSSARPGWVGEKMERGMGCDRGGKATRPWRPSSSNGSGSELQEVCGRGSSHISRATLQPATALPLLCHPGLLPGTQWAWASTSNWWMPSRLGPGSLLGLFPAHGTPVPSTSNSSISTSSCMQQRLTQ
ncbi:hypothetical protein NDU88_007781 [Pleurodeles waltl]|uniref:Secreted protein n=1 Tax=Pleurodeles waltl TaxID=8319 RepID=A0AAV7QLV7_PLEWA|nr:hypothetical protein NDU88_007781 [Pleurodeles waltl]